MSIQDKASQDYSRQRKPNQATPPQATPSQAKLNMTSYPNMTSYLNMTGLVPAFMGAVQEAVMLFLGVLLV